jgi:hypothetical protein
MWTATAPFRLMTAVVLMVPILLACGSCAPAVTSATTGPAVIPPPTAQMTRVPAVRAVADSGTSGPISATARCPGGQVMLGGSYALSSTASVQRAAVPEDYPSSASAWTVTVINADVGGPLTLTVYADCLHAQFSVTTQLIVMAPTVPNDASLHTFVAHCPMGTTVTGGGYRDAGYGGSPTGDGWQTTYIPRGENPPATVRIFALCASHNLQPGVIATDTQAVAVGGTATVSIVCPAGGLLVGGGYRYDGTPSFAFVDAPVSDFASWQVQLADQGIAGGLGRPGTLAASAVCVRIASPITGS